MKSIHLCSISEHVPYYDTQCPKIAHKNRAKVCNHVQKYVGTEFAVVYCGASEDYTQ